MEKEAKSGRESHMTYDKFDWLKMGKLKWRQDIDKHKLIVKE